MTCRLTDAIDSFVCDQISKSSPWRPWDGNLTISETCRPRHDLQSRETFSHLVHRLEDNLNTISTFHEVRLLVPLHVHHHTQQHIL